MKRNFMFDLTGKAFFPVFYSFFLIMALYEVILFLSYRFYTAGDVRLAVYMGVVFGGLAVLLIVSVIYQILFARKIIPSFSFDRQPFRFNGKIGEFLGMNLLGIFLTVITLGIYFPWYVRKITVYMTVKTDYKGTRLEFLSRGGKLFLIFLLTLVLPMLAVIILLAVYFYLAGTGTENINPATAAVTALIYVILIPFLYKFYQWYVNGISWNNKRLNWDTKFWRSVFFILGQMILTVITLGIYWPVAFVRAYRYFVSRTRVLLDDTLLGRFAFEGKIGEGFLLLWGQLLLSLITLFIYCPWAMVKIVKWFSEKTFYIKSE